MFVHYYTHVPVSLGMVEARIDDLRSRMEHWADAAYRDGEELYANVGPRVGGYAKKVRLSIGMPEIRRAGIVYPISWTATGAEALFPRLTADLVLSHVGRERTKLSLEGTYEPPLGIVGKAVNRAVLKNVADATVQDWVDRLAAAVSTAQPVS